MNEKLPGLDAEEFTLLTYLYEEYKKNRSIPYLKDMARVCGLNSATAAWRILKKLEKKGYIVKLKYKERGVRLTYLTDEVMENPQRRLL